MERCGTGPLLPLHHHPQSSLEHHQPAQDGYGCEARTTGSRPSGASSPLLPAYLSQKRCKVKQMTRRQTTPPNSDTPNLISDSRTTDSSTTPMDTTSNTRLSTTYYQTRNTRRSGTSTTLHNLDTCSNSNTCTTHIGSYDMDNSINSTFLASRSNHNTNTHQNILLTFDPSDMSCTSCTTPHNITIPEPDSPVTYILSDQNFPGGLGGGGRVVTALEL